MTRGNGLKPNVLGAALTGSAGVKCLQNNIYDPLRRKNVPSAYSSSLGWVQKGILRYLDCSSQVDPISFITTGM
jgi:hypothetical protein